MPAPHHSSFLQVGCPSCRPTNSVKALKAEKLSTFFWPNAIYFGAKLIVHNIRKIFRYRLELEQ